MESKLQPGIGPASASWHRKNVRQVFKSLDSQQLGSVTLDDLKHSFEALHVPMDEQTFENYVQTSWPAGHDKHEAGVTKSEFVKFHAAVWENQPAAVRRHCGDPDLKPAVTEPTVDEDDVDPDMKPAVPSFYESRSEPKMCTISDLRDQEHRLRKAFMKHADNSGTLVSSDRIPAVLQDIGIPEDASDISNIAEAETGSLSFNETVKLVNRCVATREEARAPMSHFERSAGQRLVSALQYAADVGDVDSEAEELATKARRALEFAVLGEDGEENDLKDKALRALEFALLGEDAEENDLKDKALQALEFALLGEDGEENDLKDKAALALETLFFGEDEVLKDKAGLALERALFGEALEDEEVDEEVMDKARLAFEAALYDEEDEEDDLKGKASLALEKAFFGAPLPEEVPVGEELMDKARFALQDALDGVPDD